MRKKIKDCVVNDYFTPNIKAEVILDALLTPYIVEIIQDQCGIKGLEFITKEMSIEDGREDNRGKKIDYMLADSSSVYMVELKTSKGSVGKDQWKNYFDCCCGEEKTFGNVFGEKLITIVKKQCKISESSSSETDIAWNTKIENIFLKFVEISGMKNLKGSNEEKAKEILKERGWNRTWKYFYTMGQLLDYYEKTKDGKLWGKKLKLIYITPNGSSIASKKAKEQYDDKTWKGFYVSPQQEPCMSVSLEKSSLYLEKMHRDDEYAELLCDIMKEIYGKKGME